MVEPRQGKLSEYLQEELRWESERTAELLANTPPEELERRVKRFFDGISASIAELPDSLADFFRPPPEQYEQHTAETARRWADSPQQMYDAVQSLGELVDSHCVCDHDGSSICWIPEEPGPDRAILYALLTLLTRIITAVHALSPNCPFSRATIPAIQDAFGHYHTHTLNQSLVADHPDRAKEKWHHLMLTDALDTFRQEMGVLMAWATAIESQRSIDESNSESVPPAQALSIQVDERQSDRTVEARDEPPHNGNVRKSVDPSLLCHALDHLCLRIHTRQDPAGQIANEGLRAIAAQVEDLLGKPHEEIVSASGKWESTIHMRGLRTELFSDGPLIGPDGSVPSAWTLATLLRYLEWIWDVESTSPPVPATQTAGSLPRGDKRLPFGLVMDNKRKTVRREGYDAEIDWNRHHEKWDTLAKMVNAHPHSAESDIGGSTTSRSTLKGNMNEDLHRIDLKIPPRKWLLKDDARDQRKNIG